MPLVPQTRLLRWSGWILFPFSIAAVIAPWAVGFCHAIMGIFLFIAGLDAFLSRRLLARIEIVLPDTIRMARGREARIPVQVRYEKGCPASLRIGLGFPSHLQPGFRDVRIDLPPDARRVMLDWPCRALKRGHMRLTHGYLEADSILGFWAERRRADVACEIRSYPDLLSERRNLAALIMHRRIGLHAVRQIGKGRDFEHLREYLPGDSYEDIHWKATAKRSTPISKVYQIERTQNIYVVIDASRLSERDAAIFSADRPVERRGRREQPPIKDRDTILERYITAALAIGMAAERQGDHFGIVTFSDHIHNFLRAGSGRAHYQSCRDALYTLAPAKVTPDFAELFTFLALKVRKRALFIFLTCLDDPALAEAFIQSVKIICKRHLLTINMLKPAAANPLFSTPNAKSTDDLYRNLAGHFLWEHLRQTAQTLQRIGVDFALRDNEKICPSLITQYQNIKQRQLL